MNTTWLPVLLLLFYLPFSGYLSDDYMAMDESDMESAVDPGFELQEVCSMNNRSFLPGEKIVYTVYYKLGFVWLSAGEVTFSVGEQGGDYHFKAFGRTSSTYDRLFKVRDTYTSRVDKKSLMPLEAIRDVNEGSYTKYAHLNFDYDNRKIVAKHGRTKDKLEVDEIEMNTCIHDVLSIIYYTRNLNLNGVRKNDVFDFNVLFDDKTYEVGLQYLGREENMRIRRAGGDFDLIKFSPNLIAGKVFNEGDRMVVWVSDDRNRIPIQIESPLKVGSVRMVLQEYEGLKYPLLAKN